MPFVAITRLRVRAPEFLHDFFLSAAASYEQADAAPGHLATDVLDEPVNVYWTKSSWDDRAAMRAFMTSGAHAQAMPLLRDWCDEAHLVHWEQESADLPSWEEAHRRLLESGRRSAVAHPSRAHLANDIPAPAVAP